MALGLRGVIGGWAAAVRGGAKPTALGLRSVIGGWAAEVQGGGKPTALGLRGVTGLGEGVTGNLPTLQVTPVPYRLASSSCLQALPGSMEEETLGRIHS